MELVVLDHFWNNGQPQPVVTSLVQGDVFENDCASLWYYFHGYLGLFVFVSLFF